MKRFTKSAVLAALLVALAGGALTACGGGGDHDDHDHKDGDGHDHSKDKK
jgi:hypothetical protein